MDCKIEAVPIFITGAAGFIGYHLALRLLSKGYAVHGMDNLNAYYEVALKKERLKRLSYYPGFSFTEGDISDKDAVGGVFTKLSPKIVVNLAAQAGVRYSIDHPRDYIDSNIVGFFTILEACRHHSVNHLVYASSSSVYGNQEKTPFSVTDPVDHPISLYAATKKSNELMAYTYSHLYGVPTTGLRFFTVYGPFGRPDMAYFKFANKIMKDEPITIYNHGDMYRDFTYVDDIVTGIENLLPHPPQDGFGGDPYRIYNIGNSTPVKLMTFIEILEKALGKEAQKEYLPMQPGDVYQTFADVSALEKDFGFKPTTTIEEGLKKFAQWYKAYYHWTA
ncbi:NAD-dependent epimerase/dehydratase family protein [Acidaminococcus intestini]